MRKKQDKDREAAGIAPAVRGGGATRGASAGRGGAPPRGGGQNRGGGIAASRAIARGVASRGRGGGSSGGRNFQAKDSTLWIHLIGLLKKKELLPVVVFTFSKKRCEENAASMPNTDLCSAAEKSEVHIAIERSLTRLKGEVS